MDNPISLKNSILTYHISDRIRFSSYESGGTVEGINPYNSVFLVKVQSFLLIDCPISQFLLSVLPNLLSPVPKLVSEKSLSHNVVRYDLRI